MNGMSALIKETFHHVRTQGKGTGYELRSRGSPECNCAGALTLDFPGSRPVSHKFLLISHPVWSILLPQPESTKTLYNLYLNFKSF